MDKKPLSKNQEAKPSKLNTRFNELMQAKEQEFLASLATKEEEYQQKLDEALSSLEKQYEAKQQELIEQQEAYTKGLQANFQTSIDQIFNSFQKQHPDYKLLMNFKASIDASKQEWETFFEESKKKFEKEIEIDLEQYNKINDANKALMATWQADINAKTEDQLAIIEADYKVKYEEFADKITSQEEIFSHQLENLQSNVSDIQKEAKLAMDGAIQIGLVKAFMDKRKELKLPHTVWAIISILSLILFVIYVFFLFWGDKTSELNLDNLQAVLSRFMLTTPMVWLVWFSIQQYNKTVELQTKYGFKEAIAKAFTGYKKEVEDLDPDFTKDFLSETIKVISEDPLESFHKKKHSSTPLTEISASLEKWFKQEPNVVLSFLNAKIENFSTRKEKKAKKSNTLNQKSEDDEDEE